MPDKFPKQMEIFHYCIAADHERSAGLFASLATKPDNGTSLTTRTMFWLFLLRFSVAFVILELLYIYIVAHAPVLLKKDAYFPNYK